MKPRSYFAGCGALIGFALGYALPAYARLPRLFYDPIARAFLVVANAGPVPMGYLGQVLYGLVGALSGAAAGALIVRRRAPSDTAFFLAGAWALTAVLVVGAYFSYNNWP